MLWHCNCWLLTLTQDAHAYSSHCLTTTTTTTPHPPHTKKKHQTPQLRHQLGKAGPVVLVLRPATFHQRHISIQLSKAATGQRGGRWYPGAPTVVHQADHLPSACVGPRQLPGDCGQSGRGGVAGPGEWRVWATAGAPGNSSSEASPAPLQQQPGQQNAYAAPTTCRARGCQAVGATHQAIRSGIPSPGQQLPQASSTCNSRSSHRINPKLYMELAGLAASPARISGACSHRPTGGGQAVRRPAGKAGCCAHHRCAHRRRDGIEGRGPAAGSLVWQAGRHCITWQQQQHPAAAAPAGSSCRHNSSRQQLQAGGRPERSHQPAWV